MKLPNKLPLTEKHVQVNGRNYLRNINSNVSRPKYFVFSYSVPTVLSDVRSKGIVYGSCVDLYVHVLNCYIMYLFNSVLSATDREKVSVNESNARLHSL